MLMSSTGVTEVLARVTVLFGVGFYRPIMGVRGKALQRPNRRHFLNGKVGKSLLAVVSTRRPSQDSVSAGAELGRWRDQAIEASFVHQNSVPSVQMHRRMTAILRAIATLAFFEPMRFASRVPHALSGDQRWTFVSSTLAASKRQVRVKRSPQLCWFSRGTEPVMQSGLTLYDHFQRPGLYAPEWQRLFSLLESENLGDEGVYLVSKHFKMANNALKVSERRVA